MDVKMKKTRIKYIIGVLIILITIGFIFLQSTDSKEVSGQKSEAVQSTITQVTHSQATTGVMFYYYLRKCAHVIEYSVLGIELAGFILFVCGRPTVQRIVNALSVGMAVGVIDESIQIISNRGSLVSDVLIDTASVVGAMAVVMLIYSVVQLIKHKKKKLQIT